MTIADQLLIARTKAGLTQEELASRIGVTNGCISLMESGKRECLDTFRQLAAALGTTFTIGEVK